MAKASRYLALGQGAKDGPEPQGCAACFRAPYKKSIKQNSFVNSIVAPVGWIQRRRLGAHPRRIRQNAQSVVSVHRPTPLLSLKKIRIEENDEATVISYTSNDFFKKENRILPARLCYWY